MQGVSLFYGSLRLWLCLASVLAQDLFFDQFAQHKAKQKTGVVQDNVVHIHIAAAEEPLVQLDQNRQDKAGQTLCPSGQASQVKRDQESYWNKKQHIAEQNICLHHAGTEILGNESKHLMDPVKRFQVYGIASAGIADEYTNEQKKQDRRYADPQPFVKGLVSLVRPHGGVQRDGNETREHAGKKVHGVDRFIHKV